MTNVIRVSIVIPVYQGEKTLPQLIAEIEPLTKDKASPSGHNFTVTEVILVHDCGPDQSHETIQNLSDSYSFVKSVWLSRNYGQHPATLAGMASSTGDVVMTIDEDGQQNPADVGVFIDIVLNEGAQVVYAAPKNPPPHGFIRNMLSVVAKRIATIIIGRKEIAYFNSFRVVDGEIARSLAAYCGSGVYLDVALLWMSKSVWQCSVMLRQEIGERRSGYSFIGLMRHFWQLLLTSGTRPLRLITLAGFISVVIAFGITVYALWQKFHFNVPVQGWTSLVIVISLFSGLILMALGIIAEYLSVTMTILMGKPLYVVSTKPVTAKKQ